MLVNRFVIRRDGVNERRGIPLALRNALRRLFTFYVEHTPLREADVFLAAANSNQQPPPPTDRVSFITTPRFNQFAMYLPSAAPNAQLLAANEYITNWISILQTRGYSSTATDSRWRIQSVSVPQQGGVALIAWAGTGRIFVYVSGQ
jgi:hypothetical protein